MCVTIWGYIASDECLSSLLREKDEPSGCEVGKEHFETRRRLGLKKSLGVPLELAHI